MLREMGENVALAIVTHGSAIVIGGRQRGLSTYLIVKSSNLVCSSKPTILSIVPTRIYCITPVTQKVQIYVLSSTLDLLKPCDGVDIIVKSVP